MGLLPSHLRVYSSSESTEVNFVASLGVLANKFRTILKKVHVGTQKQNSNCAGKIHFFIM